MAKNEYLFHGIEREIQEFLSRDDLEARCAPEAAINASITRSVVGEAGADPMVAALRQRGAYFTPEGALLVETSERVGTTVAQAALELGSDVVVTKPSGGATRVRVTVTLPVVLEFELPAERADALRACAVAGLHNLKISSISAAATNDA